MIFRLIEEVFSGGHNDRYGIWATGRQYHIGGNNSPMCVYTDGNEERDILKNVS